MNYLVRDRDVIFSLAGQVSHIDSMRDPYTDLRDQLPQPADRARGVPQPQPGREGGVRRHAAGVRQARLAAGDRTHLVRPTDVNGINKAAGEHLPSGLQQRLRRARLLAAPDQRLRSATADQPQPPGVHRLVHPPRHRGSDDSDLRRRLAAARFRLRRATRPTRSCEPARATRATARCSTSAATSRSAIAT